MSRKKSQPNIVSRRGLDVTDIRDGDLSLRKHGGKVYLYTKDGNVPYRVAFERDNKSEGNITQRESRRKGIRNLPDEHRDYWDVKQGALISPSSTSDYYFLTGKGFHASANTISTSAPATFAVEDVGIKTLWLAPYRAVLRTWEVVFTYRTSAMNGANGSVGLYRVPSPTHGDTADYTATLLDTISFTAAGEGKIHKYVETFTGIKTGANELAQGESIAVAFNRSSGSSSTVTCDVRIAGEYI